MGGRENVHRFILFHLLSFYFIILSKFSEEQPNAVFRKGLRSGREGESGETTSVILLQNSNRGG
jgi:hypothetical protein